MRPTFRDGQIKCSVKIYFPVFIFFESGKESFVPKWADSRQLEIVAHIDMVPNTVDLNLPFENIFIKISFTKRWLSISWKKAYAKKKQS